jgi:hypothetical protein
MGIELFQTYEKKDGQTGMTQLIVAFRNFSKAPHNLYKIRLRVYEKH